MEGSGDMVLKVILRERPRCGFALHLPFLAVSNKDAGSMKRSEDITGKCSANVILAVMLLNMLQVCGVVNNVHAEERNSHLIGGTISLVQ